MAENARTKIDMDFGAFVLLSLQKPLQCTNLDQLRSCVSSLSHRIGELEWSCNYAPDSAYMMLAQYNAKQNTLLFIEFANSYT